ncbi:MAG TPA: type II secretion system F family protein, partial [Dehalococcoidia bacterium]|nr:type II secretion system F family protein [Dehalococcoidia bacterium]
MRYKYLASTPQGEMRAGELEAETEKDAEEALWQAGLTILRLRKLKKGGEGLRLESLSPTLFGVRRGEIIHFTRGLANLLGAGISEVPSLKMLQAQSSGPFGRVLNRVIEDISRGDSFSQALARHPQVFSTLYLRLIQVGEEIGSLPLVLRQLEVHLERERETAIRVRGALGYPAFIAVLAVGVVVILVTFVLPSMRALLREWGGSLPLTTRALVAIASFLRERGGLVMVSLALG